MTRRDDEVAADAGEEFHVAGKLGVDAHDATARVDQRNLLHDALPHATLELERGVVVLGPGVELEVDDSNVVLGRQHHLARVRSRVAQVQRKFHVVVPGNPKLRAVFPVSHVLGASLGGVLHERDVLVHVHVRAVRLDRVLHLFGNGRRRRAHQIRLRLDLVQRMPLQKQTLGELQGRVQKRHLHVVRLRAHVHVRANVRHGRRILRLGANLVRETAVRRVLERQASRVRAHREG